MYYAGIDIGSVSTDVVIIDQDKKVSSSCVLDTGPSFKNAADNALKRACAEIGIRPEEINAIVSTGYGRKNVEIRSKAITEIKSHGLGVYHLTPQVKTIIDIGGQDCKVIELNGAGLVENFVMNDKCSAGTGRFIDVMARALGVSLNDMGPLSLKAERTCRISSICTVFAESEVITKLSDNFRREDIIQGIHMSVAERVANLVKRIGLREPVGISGGGGRNIGIIKAIEKVLSIKAITYENPQIIGALGSSLEARRIDFAA